MKLPDRFPDFSRNRLSWQDQKGLEIFKDVLYAEQEQNPRWDLPGHGSAFATCGDVFALGCDKTGVHPNGKVFRRLQVTSCRKKSCPVDYESWGSNEAEKGLVRMAVYVIGNAPVAEIIREFKKAYEKAPKKIFHEKFVIAVQKEMRKKAFDRKLPFGERRRFRPFHVVFSPPQDHKWDTAQDFIDDKNTAYEIAKAHGIDAGCLIPHPYRLRCKKCRSVIPDHRKKCCNTKCGSKEFEWFFSPHFHCIGFGWLNWTKQDYEETRWVVKNLSDGNNGDRSVYATLRYLLSHCGVSRFHSLTWFGNLGYHAKLMLDRNPIPKVGSLRSLCPVCGSFLRPLKWIGLDRPPPDLEYSKDPYKNDSWNDPKDWRCF